MLAKADKNLFRNIRPWRNVQNYLCFCVLVIVFNLFGVATGQSMLTFTTTIGLFGGSSIASALLYAVRLQWAINRSAYHLKELLKLKPGDPVPSSIGPLKSILLSNLRTVQAMGSAVSPGGRAALVSLIRSELTERVSVYHASASALAALGLIGSFIGALLMVRTAAAALAGGADNLLENFGGVFAAMALSYVTSILASVLGGFVLSGIATRLDAANTRFCDTLEVTLEFAALDQGGEGARGRAPERDAAA